MGLQLSYIIGPFLWFKPRLVVSGLTMAKLEPPCLPCSMPLLTGTVLEASPQLLSSVHLCPVAVRTTIACFCFFGSADKMEQNKSNAKLHISWLGKQKPSLTLETLPDFYFHFSPDFIPTPTE